MIKDMTIMMMMIMMMLMTNLEQRLYGRFCPNVVEIATLSYDQLPVH